MTGMRRTALVVAGLALLPSLPDAVAAPKAPPLVRRQFVATRTTSGPAEISLDVQVQFDGRGGFGGAVMVRDGASGAVAETFDGVVATFGEQAEPDAYHDGPLPACAPGISCSVTWTSGSGLIFVNGSDTGGDVANRLYVAVEGLGVDVVFRGRGWHLAEVGPTFSYVLAQRSEATGTGVAGRGVEVFTSATSRTARGASIALGQPPCAYSITNTAARGAGTAKLVGGKHTPEAVCPRDIGPLTAAADRPTTWRLEGVVAGETTMSRARLLVFGVVSHATSLRARPRR